MTKQMPAYVYNQDSKHSCDFNKAFADMTVEEKVDYYKNECEDVRRNGKYREIGA